MSMVWTWCWVHMIGQWVLTGTGSHGHTCIYNTASDMLASLLRPHILCDQSIMLLEWWEAVVTTQAGWGRLGPLKCCLSSPPYLDWHCGGIRGTAELHRPPGSSSCTAKSALMTRESHRLHHFAIASLPHSPSIYLVNALISGFLSFCGHKIHVTSLMARYSIRVVCPCSWFCSNSCLAQNKLFSFLNFHLLISMYVLVCALTPQHICGVCLWESALTFCHVDYGD